MLDMMNVMPAEAKHTRRTRSNTMTYPGPTQNSSTPMGNYQRAASQPKQRTSNQERIEEASSENWDEVLLTPESFVTTKKPLTPPKKREAVPYSSLQEFLLSHSSTNLTEVAPPSAQFTPTEVSTPEKTIPTRATLATSPPKGTNEERFAGAAFCNSPSPNTLPLPVFDSSKMRSQSFPNLNIAPSPPKEVYSQSFVQLPTARSEMANSAASRPQEQTETRRPSPPQRNNKGSKNQSREEVHQPSPTKKRTYVPKGTRSADPSPLPSPQTPNAGLEARTEARSPSPQAQKPELEQLSNQLKMMLKIA